MNWFACNCNTNPCSCQPHYFPLQQIDTELLEDAFLSGSPDLVFDSDGKRVRKVNKDQRKCPNVPLFFFCRVSRTDRHMPVSHTFMCSFLAPQAAGCTYEANFHEWMVCVRHPNGTRGEPSPLRRFNVRMKTVEFARPIPITLSLKASL